MIGGRSSRGHELPAALGGLKLNLKPPLPPPLPSAFSEDDWGGSDFRFTNFEV